MARRSIVEFFPDSSPRSCGYCKNKSSSVSQGMWGHFLTPRDYQDLIDRGWRRSGQYCYKPTMGKTCCPQYTIRCDATGYRPSKSQKKAAKKFRSYIVNGTRGGGAASPPPPSEQVSPPPDGDADDSCQEMVEDAEKRLKLTVGEGEFEMVEAEDVSKEVPAPDKDKKGLRQGTGPDPSKPKRKKAKEIRKEKALMKLRERGGAPKQQQQQQPKNKEVDLEELLSFVFEPGAETTAHGVRVRMVRACSDDEVFAETFEASYELYRKYQVAIHNDKPDDVGRRQFKRFLCSSPIVEGAVGGGGEGASFPFPSGFGGYHMQYWIDGRLACVGVLDVLPRCLSSVYLYYDPDFSFLSFGTVSAVLELIYTKRLQSELAASIRFYYMGYYIHSCPKMRYKARYEPSWLLCPQTFEWVDVRRCMPLLDAAKCSRLNPASLPPDRLAVTPTKDSLAAVSVLHMRQAMPYRLYNRHFDDNRELSEEDSEVAEYLVLVGERVARSMLLYRS